MRSSDCKEESSKKTVTSPRKIDIVHLTGDTNSLQNCCPSSGEFDDYQAHESSASSYNDSESTSANWRPPAQDIVNNLHTSMNNSSQKSLASSTGSYPSWRNSTVVHPPAQQSSSQSHDVKETKEHINESCSDDDDNDDDFTSFFIQPEDLGENNEYLASGAPPIPFEYDTVYGLPHENVSGREVPSYDQAGGFANSDHPAVLEFINTEKTYVKSLQFIVSSIRDNLNKVPEVDVNILFSNIDEVHQVANSFLTELNQTDSGGENLLIHIGDLFQQYRWDMEEVYSRYCWGYDRALVLLKQYKETHIPVYESIQQALMTASAPSTQYSDITYYLVKPVQRVTKYPLLLKRILEIKSLSKEAHNELEGAFQAALRMNEGINEKKRRKELAVRYVQGDQRTIKEKVSNVNKHTITKKMMRISQHAKLQTGMIPKREDKEFDGLVKHFHYLTLMVSQLQQNVVSYVQNLEQFLLRPPDTSCMEEEPEETQHKPSFSQELHQNIYSVFKRRLQLLVLQPLSNLSECLKGPNNLIRKRIDKLLDYENLEEKYSDRTGTGKMSLEEEEIVKTYKAIHELLLSELPHCISVSKKLLCHLLLSYIKIHQELTDQGLHVAEAEASRLEHTALPTVGFMKWVGDCMTLSDVQLESFIKTFSELMPPPPAQDQSPVQDRQFQLLLRRYEPDKIYQVMQNISGSKTLDLMLNRGDFVAVLQFSDTKGNKSRWLVDTGGVRGYAPCNKLQSYNMVTARKNSLDSLAPVQNFTENRRHSSTARECPYPAVPKPAQTFQDIAMYAFTARSNHEVSLKQGEPVIILEPHDKRGSPDWSLVEVSGQRGYVPSNHLGKMPVQNSSPYGTYR
uniref:Rho guanine nucleotide exchange factor 37 n=1 Tax=Leptobrachium leishanense TaxID=445787 RepID=A0A8C5MV31_9ANUR